MKTYREWQPTAFDSRGLGLEDRQDWIVAPVIQTRDSGALERSNFRVVLTDLGGESDTVEVHRFGHWGPGWFEIILAHPGRAQTVADWESRLEDYPVANEEDFSAEEYNEANEVWKNCYNVKERIAYIREHESQFEFRSFADLRQCVRGEYFGGYASELIG